MNKIILLLSMHKKSFVSTFVTRYKSCLFNHAFTLVMIKQIKGFVVVPCNVLSLEN